MQIGPARVAFAVASLVVVAGAATLPVQPADSGWTHSLGRVPQGSVTPGVADATAAVPAVAADSWWDTVIAPST